MTSSLRYLQKSLQASLGRSQAVQELAWMRKELRAFPDSHDTESADSRLATWIKRRIAGEPLQYILGNQPFGPLEIITRSPVLIPRPETEEWVMQLSQRFDPSAREGPVSVLDLCTGTGCIPLMLSHIWSPGKVRALGVDISADAIDLAKENLMKRGAHEAEFLRGDMFDHRFCASISEKGRYDIITCNPPYIPLDEYARLSRSVKDWEDPRALVGEYPVPEDVSRNETIGSSGLRFYARLAELIPDLLVQKEGMAVFEFGHGQGSKVMDILKHLFRQTELWKDHSEKERAFAGWT
ncbi:S-adenosyl-L-methionine-dependent methyltransferase [Dacryopinax primogenitus]|uniref:S-adenosyl-L-methionine-dependent methyltransferase n=1 Tax=Dacryopinax primogenitus (strain DJM 731) TaxID=1858805 RepID=M5G2D7_DACPD|nr:S-adenosyl-L-methionine-dependent methyltransferase [Dacryopinax primogenitus]EJU04371.1 S-adenosyl-L-methionine-dependent methyltransferase [Dacryopinax primogenitus]